VELDIDVYKDRDYKQVFNIKDGDDSPIDVSGWTFAAQIRPTYGSDSLIATFTVEKTTAVSGIITMSLSDTETAEIDTTPEIRIGSTTTSNNMTWDMVVEDDIGDRYSLIQGICTVNETVTRAS
jgi:hypothetical protein